MARFYKATDDRLDETIRTAEAKLDAMYAKRAGRRNWRQGDRPMGWIYCDCGRVNMGDDCEAATYCAVCKRRAEDAPIIARMRAHDAGEHAIAADPSCAQCDMARRAAEYGL